MDAAAESGMKEPVRKHQIEPENERGGTGRDGRSRLARPNA